MPSIGSAHIVTRTTSKGEKRYHVRYRLGGQAFPLVHAGSFKKMAEAKMRRDFIAGDIASGRDPAESLRALALSQRERMTFREWGVRYRDNRRKLAPSSLRQIDFALRSFDARFGELDPFLVSRFDVEAWVEEASATLSPATIAHYMSTLRKVLDYAGVDPNPARDKRVELPRKRRKEIEPPTGSEVAALISAIPEKYRLPVRLLEATGMRLGELLGLEWRDVEVRTRRLRIRDGKTDSARRWVEVPEDLFLEIPSGSGRIFPSITAPGLYNAMAKTCRDLGARHISPHMLRHRWISVGLRDRPVLEVQRAAGHARASMTLDTYGHVILEDGGDAPVMHGATERPSNPAHH